MDSYLLHQMTASCSITTFINFQNFASGDERSSSKDGTALYPRY